MEWTQRYSDPMTRVGSWPSGLGVKRSRREAYEHRTGRRASSPRTVEESPSGRARADAYQQLQTQLVSLRAAVATDGRDDPLLVDVRRAHADLDRALTDAVRQAFAADAQGAPTPDGITSWAAEGMARSQEHELALLAAADVSGNLQTTTVPAPAWGPPMQ
jgi:hypothetical protein